MQQRNPLYAALIWLIPIVGILVWFFTWYLPTKREMNAKYNAGIITGWICLVPFIGFLIFHWSYAGGAAKVHGKYSQGLGFILMLFILPVGAYLQQAAFNEVAARGGAPGTAMQAR
ncbi:MAG: hypothetical protein KA201_14945 [Kofleriaceae bacterium]|nr:hypothetical protein [Kofleriaceae bacterium]